MALTRFALALLIGVALGAAAQEFPKGQVRLVVPFTPGGPTDVIARLMSQKLQEVWGRPVLVDYKPGAGTVVGIDHVAKSPADGHTVGIVVSSYTINPVLRRQMPYDTLNGSFRRDAAYHLPHPPRRQPADSREARRRRPT